MKYVKRQEGMILPLVVGLVALILVVVGLAVWQSQQAKKTADSTNTTPSPTSAAQGSRTPAPTATPTQSNVLTVTELGFKMTLPVGLTGLNYVAQTNLSGSFSDGSSYTLSTSRYSTTSLERLDSQCTAANDAIGTIVRYSEDPQNRVSGVAELRKVGNIYLGLETPQQPCSSSTAAGQLETSQIQLLRQAFDSATAL